MPGGAIRVPLASFAGRWYGFAARTGLPSAASRQAERHEAQLVPDPPQLVVAGSAPGPPLRLLLLGNGPAESPGLSPGAAGFHAFLAAALAGRAGRRVEVRPLMGGPFELPELRTRLAAARLAEQDAVVVSAAYRPALAEIPLARWRAYTEALRALLVEEAGPRTVIRVLTLPWRQAAREAPAQWGGLFGNRVIVVAETAEAVLTPDQPARALRLHGPLRRSEWVGPAFTPQTYLRWADQVAAEIAAALPR
jgi:hypothetical protein